MLDLSSEQPITLAEAAQDSILPRGKKGKPRSASTMTRWTRFGCRSRITGEYVILESQQIGGAICTSREAIRRFIHRLTTGDKTAKETPSQRRAAYERADRNLQSRGL